MVFGLLLLRRDSDIVVSLPVVEHVVKLFLCVNLLPSHALVAELAHLFKQLVQFFASVPVHVHGVH